MILHMAPGALVRAASDCDVTRNPPCAIGAALSTLETLLIALLVCVGLVLLAVIVWSLLTGKPNRPTRKWNGR